MLTFTILLIIVGLLAVFFGILQNTILFNLFADLNAQLERANLENGSGIARLFDGPGTAAVVIGFLAFALGVTLLVIRSVRNKRLRELNKNIKSTNKRRKQQGKRVPK